MKRDLVSLAVVIAVTVGVLAGLNALPAVLGGEPRGVVRYHSIQALERRHHALWHPAAVPAPWASPPSRIRLAVGDPDWVEFEYGAGGDWLVICQANEGAGTKDRVSAGALDDDPNEAVPQDLLPTGQMLQTVDTSIAGRDARLRRLLLADGTIVHEMWWREGATRIMLRLRGSADRLPAIAGALLGQR